MSTAAQKLGPAEDRIERRAQLVADGGEEIVLEPAGFLRLGLRPLGDFLGADRLPLGLFPRCQVDVQRDGFVLGALEHGHAHQHPQHGFPNDELEHIALPGSDRYANADLMGPLRHRT